MDNTSMPANWKAVKTVNPHTTPPEIEEKAVPPETEFANPQQAYNWLPQAQQPQPEIVKSPKPAKPTVNAPVRVLLVALGLGWAFDFLFNGKAIGISALLFIGLTLTALFVLGKMEKVQFSSRNLWLLIPILFFATMIFVRANAGLTVLNIFAVFFLFSLLIYFYAADHLERLTIFGYPIVFLKNIGAMLVYSAPVIKATSRKAAAHKGRFRLALPLLRGVLIAIPILGVFVILLSSADSIFEGYTSDFFKLNFMRDLPSLLEHVLWIAIVGYLVTGAFVYALVRHRGPGNGAARSENLPGTLVPNPLVGFSEGTIVLVLVNLLFAGFAWIQFTYLFSGQAVKSMDYINFQEYVRRGFNELLIAAVLTMLLILGLRWLSRNNHPAQILVFNILSTITILLAMVMIVSAFQRMVEWEKVEYYVNTQLRIYVRSFILWLGLSFGWLFLTLWVRRQRFSIGFFVALLGFLVTVNIMNPDADVAISNIERYQGRREEVLAYRYLGDLSDDAVPALVSYLDQTTGEVQQRIRNNLSDRLAMLEYTQKSWQGWQSFHVARWQAYTTLTKLRADKRI